jgi:hypothetical protein
MTREGRMLRSKIIAAVACLGIILAGTGELAFGETAEVLPKGISRVNVMYSYYQPIDQRFDSDGNTEDVDSDFNFPISAALIGGSISSIVGDAVVDFEYIYRDLIIDYQYGLTDNLTLGIHIPYYWNKTDLKQLAVDNTNADPPYNGYPPAVLLAGLTGALEADPFNYDPLKTWSDSGISDIEIGTRYKYHDDETWRLAFTGGLRLPTGETDDPDNLLDTEFGAGAYALMLRFNNDYVGIEDVLLNITVSYDLTLESSAKVRVPSYQGETIMPSAQKESVDRNLGDIFRLSFYGDYTFSDKVSTGLEYEYASKGKDSVSGDMGWLYSELEEDSDWTSQTLVANVTYSTVQAYMDEEAAIPFDAYLEYESVFKGTNEFLKQDFISLGFNLYF